MKDYLPDDEPRYIDVAYYKKDEKLMKLIKEIMEVNGEPEEFYDIFDERFDYLMDTYGVDDVMAVEIIDELTKKGK